MYTSSPNINFHDQNTNYTNFDRKFKVMPQNRNNNLNSSTNSVLIYDQNDGIY